jgi:hypothetical protein
VFASGFLPAIVDDGNTVQEAVMEQSFSGIYASLGAHQHKSKCVEHMHASRFASTSNEHAKSSFCSGFPLVWHRGLDLACIWLQCMGDAHYKHDELCKMDDICK